MESTIEIVQVKASELVPAEYNPRQASEKECQDLKASILAFGLVDPIIVNSAVNRKNIVIGGHFRLRMAIEMGFETIPVVYLNIPELVKEQELNLRLNKNSGQWDFDLLANFDEELLKLSGFKSDELQKIFDIDVQEDGFDAEAEYGKISEAQTKPGDIYQLGAHRLMCGDSTKQEDVARLMGAELADMMFTDPPYNVNYNYAKYDAIGKHRKKRFERAGKIFNDNKTAASFYCFLSDMFKLAYQYNNLVQGTYDFGYGPGLSPDL